MYNAPPLVIRNPNFWRGKTIFLISKEQQTLQARNLRTSETLIFFLKGWLASTFLHVWLHSIARMACQKLMLEMFILIFRAPCVVLAPGSWLGQKKEIATRQKLIFLNFCKTPPGVPGGPTGSLGIPWGIYQTKTKPKAQEIELLGSRRPSLVRKHRKSKSKKKLRETLIS